MRSGSVLKRFIGAAMCGALVMAGISGCRIQYVEDETASEETAAESMEEDRQVDINLWYSDEIYSDYLSMCAAQYENANKMSISILNIYLRQIICPHLPQKR